MWLSSLYVNSYIEQLVLVPVHIGNHSNQIILITSLDSGPNGHPFKTNQSTFMLLGTS